MSRKDCWRTGKIIYRIVKKKNPIKVGETAEKLAINQQTSSSETILNNIWKQKNSFAKGEIYRKGKVKKHIN